MYTQVVTYPCQGNHCNRQAENNMRGYSMRRLGTDRKKRKKIREEGRRERERERKEKNKNPSVRRVYAVFVARSHSCMYATQGAMRVRAAFIPHSCVSHIVPCMSLPEIEYLSQY